MQYIKEKQNDLFCELIGDIINSDDFCGMKKVRHHQRGNVYDHSVKVAYLCYRHCKKFNSRVNLNELVRSALLHDYFLYDRHDKNGSERINGLVHGFTHAHKAFENAMKAYPDLTLTEQNTIKRHMFPLTPVPPRTKCGWLVCFYDKVAAIGDFLGR